MQDNNTLLPQLADAFTLHRKTGDTVSTNVGHDRKSLGTTDLVTNGWLVQIPQKILFVCMNEDMSKWLLKFI